MAAEAAPPVRMFRLLGGFQITQALYTVVRLGVPDLLDAPHGPRPVADVAAECGAKPDLLRRLVAVLAHDEVFRYDPATDVASLGPLGHTLTHTSPDSLRDLALMWTETHYAPFAGLADSVAADADDRPAAEHVYGVPFFDWLGRDAARIAQFTDAMTDLLSALRPRLAEYIDVGGTESTAYVVDVGGADGALLAAVAEHHPGVRGTVFDLPHVVPAASALIAGRSLSDRITVAGGDFFLSVPPGGDYYHAAMVLHDWPDDAARRILTRIRESAAPGGQLRLSELVLGDDGPGGVATLMDLTMMGMLAGRERDAAMWRELLASAGWHLDRIVRTPGPMSVLEASPART